MIKTTSILSLLALAGILSVSPVRAWDSVSLDSGDSEAAAPGSNGGSNILPAIGGAFKNVALDAVETRAVVGEGLLRTGLDKVSLPPMARMRENIDSWGETALGEEKWGPLRDAWDAGAGKRRGDFIRQNGIYTAMSFNRGSKRTQPATYYYDNLVRPGVSRWWGRMRGQ